MKSEDYTAPAWVAKRPWLARPHRFLARDLWRLESSSLPTFTSFFVRTLRVTLLAVRGFVHDKCMMRAAALTYLTVFSMVPLLAFGFALAKGFGAAEYLEDRVILPFLDQAFPVAAEAEGSDSASARLREASTEIFELVDNTDLKGLGVFGLVFLLYSVVKLLGAVETSMNEVWGVKGTRSLGRRVSNYIALVVMTPIILVTGAGVAALFQEGGSRLEGIGAFQGIQSLFLKLLPVLVVWLGMTYLYLTLPNTRVKLSSAVLGGIVAGSLWQLAQISHVKLQVGMANFNAIYAGFAVLPIFLLWIYLNWMTLFLGIEVTFAHQNESRFEDIARMGPVDQSYRESLALRLCGRIAHAFLEGEAAPTPAGLAEELGLAPRSVAGVLDELALRGLLVRADEDFDGGYLPARSPQDIRLLDLVLALRRGQASQSPPVRSSMDERADRALESFEQLLSDSEANVTLRDFALRSSEGFLAEGSLRPAVAAESRLSDRSVETR